MSEIKRLTRNYEVSVWTLQDGFITVLGSSNAHYRGRIQNPEMKLVNDGTQEFSFSIPMYLDNGVNRTVNPVWSDMNNAAVIAGMRKIKVIFNKGTEDEAVFEFLITKVTKIHENDKPACEVNCEGLAFHELGKLGYKYEFSTDVLVEESKKWDEGRPVYGTYESPEDWQAAETAWNAKEPRPTIDYWMHEVLEIDKYPSSEEIDATRWYYKVDMDWSDYSQISDLPRESDKIYEEELVTAWDENLMPKDSTSVSLYKEKTRLMDEKESNIYNLTQKLAETFGVFCRYDYSYDDNYHIKSRVITFYNKGVKDKERKFSFTYPYSSKKISREDDCTDIVTKMYVTAIEDQSTESGLVTIMNSSANKTREDYLLNFDYLHSINTITDEQYAAISEYEINIRRINDEIAPYQDQLLVVEDRLPKTKALQTTAINAAQLDSERIYNSEALARALDMSDAEQDGYIHVKNENADSAILMPMDDTKFYYFTAPKQGIAAHTVRIYEKEFDLHNAAGRNIGDLYPNGGMAIGTPEYNEFGDFIRMINIPKNSFKSGKNIVYLTYKYSPKLYYEKITEVWKTRLAKDQADIETYTAELEQLLLKKRDLDDTLTALRQEKRQLIKEFECLMGPALREGQWNPDNYDTTTGEKYVDQTYCSDIARIPIRGTTDYFSFIWDTEPFDDEQLGTYKIGINTTEMPYECIVLTDQQMEYINQCIEDNLPVGVLYYDYVDTTTNPNNNEQIDIPASDVRCMRCLAIGASAQIALINNGGVVKFALLLTGITTEDTLSIDFLKGENGQAQIGYLATKTNPSNNQLEVMVDTYEYLHIGANQWLNSTPNIVYPRCKISSLTLKNNSNDLTLSYNYTALKEFEDYYTFQRIDEVNGEYKSNYYITLKPMVFFKAGVLNAMLGIRYSLSNASTAIYVDAQDVLKENSKPKVTYTLDPNILAQDFTYTAYNALNIITFINDYELQFDGAQGYISSVSLNLDFPKDDSIEIKNYKNKFEDLFSTIVAQTQAMEKNESIFAAVAKAVSIDGSLTAPALEGALRKVDLNYAFNQGKLTINEKDGIWGTSEDGVVAYRGGGIFTATKKDDTGNWVWNTGIVPSGINANLITTGQLDTNKIKVYSGDRIRFQLNGDGLFAYKSLFSDFDILTSENSSNYKTEFLSSINNKANDVDYAQYIVMNEDGLFLNVKKNTLVANAERTDFIKIGYDTNGNPINNFPDILSRVEISWDGLKLKNWENKEVFYADPNTGNLTVTGTIQATGLYIQQGDDMQQVLFSVDPTNHTINLSSTNFDQLGTTEDQENGIEASGILITPDSITVTSSGTVNIAAGKISMNAVNGLDNAIASAGSNKYTIVNEVAISRQGIDIQGGHINLDTNDGNPNTVDSYLHMSPAEIDMNAGSIKVKGLPIWERNDIIYLDSDPRYNGSIRPPSGRAWLWVKPLGRDQQTSRWSGTAGNTLTGGSMLNWTSGVVTYTVTASVAANFGGNDALNGCLFTFNFANAGNPNNTTNCSFYYNLGSGNNISYNIGASWTAQANVFNPSGAITFSFSGTWNTSYTNFSISSVTLTASAESGSGIGSQCVVYYFPSNWNT